MKTIKPLLSPIANRVSVIEVKPNVAPLDAAETASFARAINALSMARRYLIEGDELAAEQKAAVALLALRQLTERQSATVALTH